MNINTLNIFVATASHGNHEEMRQALDFKKNVSQNNGAMKNNLLVRVAAVWAALFLGLLVVRAVETEQSAPDFTLTDIGGKTHSLSDFRGKTVVLEWMNQGRPFVVKHYDSGNMPAMQRDAIADGVVWLVINSGCKGAQGDLDLAEVKSWRKEKGASFTAYFRDRDSSVGHLYGAKTTPHMYVISAEGTLVYQGAIDSIRSAKISDIDQAENYVRSALKDISDGKSVRTDTTRPYGCSVKY